MTFGIVHEGEVVDLLQYMAFSTFDGKDVVVSGENAGKSIVGTHILDDLRREKHFSFTSKKLSSVNAKLLEEYFRQRPFMIVTDYFTDSAIQINMICDEISKVVVNSGPSELFKITAELVEL